MERIGIGKREIRMALVHEVLEKAKPGDVIRIDDLVKKVHLRRNDVNLYILQKAAEDLPIKIGMRKKGRLVVIKEKR